MITIELKELGKDYYETNESYFRGKREKLPVIILNGDCKRLKELNINGHAIIHMIDKKKKFLAHIIDVHTNYFIYEKC